MTKIEEGKLVELLRKLKKEYPKKVGSHSTISECSDFLIAACGGKV